MLNMSCPANGFAGLDRFVLCMAKNETLYPRDTYRGKVSFVAAYRKILIKAKGLT